MNSDRIKNWLNNEQRRAAAPVNTEKALDA
jgi:hypothetical protein